MASRSSEEETPADVPVAPSAEQKPAEHLLQPNVSSGETIQGFIERIEPQRVSGWAWDRLAPEVFLTIEVVLDGKILATTRADRFREDLKSGTGDGCHAFQAFLDEPIPEQMKHRITAVARSRNGGAATRLVNLVCDPPAESAAPTVATPMDSGYIAPGARQWLVQLAAADRRLQATCSAALGEVQQAVATVAATAAEVAETVRDLRATQEQLAQQLAASEVFQARFDATLKGLEEKATVAGGSGRPDRGLRTAVAALSVIATASLALGLWSIIGG
jgi:hypothetical protein